MATRGRANVVRVTLAAAAGVAVTIGMAMPVAGEGDFGDRRASYVIDGDTAEVSPTIHDTEPVRLLNIDTPEIDGDTQEPWATDARNHLHSLLRGPSREFSVEPDAVLIDQYDRVLGHLTRSSDDLDINREMLRSGDAVLHVLWPNVAHFEEYRRAQQEAQAAGRGIWDPEAPLQQLPYVYRLRHQGEEPDKLVGDWFTRKYVAPEDLHEVHVNNRVFFWNTTHADNAGFTPCEQDVDGTYDPSCFSKG